jgi:hypothetical protein
VTDSEPAQSADATTAKPRFFARITRVRGIIGLVVLVALMLWGWVTYKRLTALAKQYDRISLRCAYYERYYRGWARDWLTELDLFSKNRARKESLWLLRNTPSGQEWDAAQMCYESNLAEAERYADLKRLFRRAARNPWIHIPVDRILPEVIEPIREADPYAGDRGEY